MTSCQEVIGAPAIKRFSDCDDRLATSARSGFEVAPRWVPQTVDRSSDDGCDLACLDRLSKGRQIIALVLHTEAHELLAYEWRQ